MKKKFYITTAIDYASGKPHIGHAYEKLSADIIARWNRKLLGSENVFFMTGTDEHGQKIAEKAKMLNKNPAEFVDTIVPLFKDLCKKLNVSYDYFIRTTDDKHKLFVSKMLLKSFENGDIYKGTYTGLYCVDCERYYAKEDLIDGIICPDHKKEVKFVKEENYFFRLSKYEQKLLNFYDKNPEFLSPKTRANEIINRVKEGLNDISISRNKKNLSWGIELPFDNEHVTYVWFDALFNYVSGLDINSKNDFWPANVHLVGKDIIWFHQVYWPAFLMSCGYLTPKRVFSHGHILDAKGHKMGKSLGNAIDPLELVEKFGLDEVRYGLFAMGSYGEDIAFDENILIMKINNELNDDLGNLISRVHAMVTKYCNGIIKPIKNSLSDIDNEFIKSIDIFETFNSEMQNLRFNVALEILWNAIRSANIYINQVSPWKINDELRLNDVMNILVSAIRLFSEYLESFMPQKTSMIYEQYNLVSTNVFKFELFLSEHSIGLKKNLFEKINAKQAIEKEKINTDDKKEGFNSLNLMVGKIISVLKHPDSEKLYILNVNLKDETRQILSGLQKIYTENELLDRKVIVLTNLKPAKLAGYESNGMILACSKEDNHDMCGLLMTDMDIGENLKCGNEIANSTKQIKINQFQEIKIIGNGSKVYHNGNEVEHIRIDKNIDGNIC